MTKHSELIEWAREEAIGFRSMEHTPNNKALAEKFDAVAEALSPAAERMAEYSLQELRERTAVQSSELIERWETLHNHYALLSDYRSNKLCDAIMDTIAALSPAAVKDSELIERLERLERQETSGTGGDMYLAELAHRSRKALHSQLERIEAALILLDGARVPDAVRLLRGEEPEPSEVEGRIRWLNRAATRNTSLRLVSGHLIETANILKHLQSRIGELEAEDEISYALLEDAKAQIKEYDKAFRKVCEGTWWDGTEPWNFSSLESWVLAEVIRIAAMTGEKSDDV